MAIFLLISFDVQDVVIDVHDFRVCSKTHKNHWKMKGFIDYNCSENGGRIT